MICNKTSYDSFAQAEKALGMFFKGRNYGNRHLSTKKPKRAYKCDECGQYHLTSKKKKR